MRGSVWMALGGCGFLAACGGGPKQLDRPRPTTPQPAGRATPTLAPSVRAAALDAKQERVLELREEAQELAERGALDVAAGRLHRVWQETRDAEALWQASLWAEEAWHETVVHDCLDELAKEPAFAQRVEARRQALPKRALEAPRPEQRKLVDPLLAKAIEQLEQGDASTAIATLERAVELTPVADLTRLVATLRWKQGEKRLAQLWWARTRASSGAEVSAADLIVVPQLHYANVSFALRPTFVSGWPFNEAGQVMALQYPTANGFVFCYAPDWGVTFSLGANAKEARHLEGPDYRSKKPYLDAAMQPLAALALPHSIGFDQAKEIAARALSEDEETLALLSKDNELWTFKVADKSLVKLVYRGPPREAGVKPTASASDSVMVHARRGKTERLYLADTADAGASLGLSLGGAVSRGDVLELEPGGRVLARIQAHRARVTSLAVSRSGTFMASAAGKSFKVWDLSTRKAVYEGQAERPVEVVHFHPSDEVLEVATDFSAERYDWRQKKALASERLDETVYRTHSRDGRHTATAHYKHEAIGVQREGSPDMHWVSGARDAVAALSDDGAQLLVGHSGLWLFQLEPWRATALTRGYAATPAFSPSGERIAACLEDGIAVFERSGKRVTTIAKKSCPEQLEFASEDELVVAHRSSLEWFAVKNGRSLRSEPGRRFYRLKAGELRLRDGTVQHRDANGARSEHAADVVGIGHARSRFIVGTKGSGVLQAFDEAGVLTAKMPSPADLDALCISDDGQLALAAIDHAGVALFDLQKRQRLRNRDDLHAGLMGTQSLQLFNGFALTAGSDGLVVWDVEDSDRSGNLNLLENGDWFSIARGEQATAVDGAPEGIDHVINDVYFYHPGSVWEALRGRGSFGAFLRGQGSL